MSTATQIMGLEKLCGLYNIIKCNGGLTKLLRQLYRTNELKCGEFIEEELTSSYCKRYPACSPLVKDNAEENVSLDTMMSARLLKWLNYITKDCFLMVPTKRLMSCDEDLQLSKLDLKLSAPQLIPPLNIWDCFSIVFPSQTIKVTELFTSEDSDGESTHYYLAITKDTMDGSTISDDISSHLSGASTISSIPFSSILSDDIYNSNDRVSLTEHLTNRNVSRQKPKISTESCKMRRCTTKSFPNTGILSTGKNLDSLRKKHIDCSSELEIECNEPSKGIRRIGSKKGGTTAAIGVDKKEEKDKKLHMERKIAADLLKAMELSGDENTNVFIDYSGKQNECNNVITDSKEIAASNNKVIACSSQDMDKSTNNLMLCSDAGKHSSASDCKSKKSGDSQHKSCKPGGHEKGEGCGENKPSCGKKHEGGCGGGEKQPKKGGNCDGESSNKDSKDEGACHPNLHRKEHPCEKVPHKDGYHEDREAAKWKGKSKEKFNNKLKSVYIKYKIEHCRQKKVNWDRSKKSHSNKSCDVCKDHLNKPMDHCGEN